MIKVTRADIQRGGETVYLAEQFIVEMLWMDGRTVITMHHGGHGLWEVSETPEEIQKLAHGALN